MRAVYADRHRESASVMHANRRYMKKGMSPDASSYISPCVKSNQQLLSQVGPHLQSQNGRSVDKCYNNFTSSSKIGNREDFAINYQIFGISNSKNIMGEQKKKGKSSYYRKIGDINKSQLLLPENKSTNTKQITKINSQQQSASIEPKNNEAQEMHYKMVDFQQLCKKVVKN